MWPKCSFDFLSGSGTFDRLHHACGFLTSPSSRRQKDLPLFFLWQLKCCISADANTEIQRLQSTIFLRRALTWLEVRPNCRGKPRRRVNSWLRSGKAPYCHRHKNNWPLLEFYSQSKKFKYKTQTQIRKWKCLQANVYMFIKHISSFPRPGLWVERRSGRDWQVLHAHQELWLQVYCHHPPSTSSLYTSVLSS